MGRINALYANAIARDTTGQVQAEQSAALTDLAACGGLPCVTAWFGRREASLSRWQE
jgi:hypothetical protein